MKISVELLFHFNCDRCNKWWSVGDIVPLEGAIVHCPHCGHENIVPSEFEIGVDGLSWEQVHKATGKNLFLNELVKQHEELGGYDL